MVRSVYFLMQFYPFTECGDDTFRCLDQNFQPICIHKDKFCDETVDCFTSMTHGTTDESNCYCDFDDSTANCEHDNLQSYCGPSKFFI